MSEDRYVRCAREMVEAWKRSRFTKEDFAWLMGLDAATVERLWRGEMEPVRGIIVSIAEVERAELQ